MGRRVQNITAGGSAAVRGQKIRTLREDRGLNLPQLANQAGLSKGYLSRLERGLIQSPADSVIEALADVLGIPIADLQGEGGQAIVTDKARFEAELDRRLQLLSEQLVSATRSELDDMRATLLQRMSTMERAISSGVHQEGKEIKRAVVETFNELAYRATGRLLTAAGSGTYDQQSLNERLENEQIRDRIGKPPPALAQAAGIIQKALEDDRILVTDKNIIIVLSDEFEIFANTSETHLRQWLDVLAIALDHDWKITHIMRLPKVAPDTEDPLIREKIEHIGSQVPVIMSLVGRQGTYEARYLTNKDREDGQPSRNFILVASQVVIEIERDMFAEDYGGAIFRQGVSTSDPDGLHEYQQYVQYLIDVSNRLFSSYPVRSDDAGRPTAATTFNLAVLDAESGGSSRRLYQRWFSTVLVPRELDEEIVEAIASEGGEYATDQYRASLDRLLSIRRQRREMMLDKLDRGCLHYDICTRIALDSILEGNLGIHDELFGAWVHATNGQARLDVRQQIMYLEALLQIIDEHPNEYQLAMVPAEAHGPRWQSSWEINGMESLLLEVWPEEKCRHRVNIMIREPSLIRVFLGYFKKWWPDVTNNNGRTAVRKEIVDALGNLRDELVAASS